MRATVLLALLTILLAGCVETGQGGYYRDPYDNGRGYYNPGHYNRGGGGGYYQEDQSERRQRRQENNCKVTWANCVNVCNTNPDANQRAVCVYNCNNFYNQCLNQ